MATTVTETCCARTNAQMPKWAPRRNARCGNAPIDVPISIHIDGVGLRELALCGLHYDVLVRSPDPNELAARWAHTPIEGATG